MIFSDLIEASNCLVDLRYATKIACLSDLVRRATKTLGLDTASVLEAIQHREALGSTGLGQGIAIPHARVPKLSVPFVLLALLREPLLFDSVDDRPVDIVCLVLLPSEPASEATKALACIAKGLRDGDITAALRRARSAEAVCGVVKRL